MSNILTGSAIDIVTFLLNADKKMLWDLAPHKKKRSLSANNYYWNLVEQIAVKSKTPKNKVHNQNLRGVGVTEKIGDKSVFLLLPDDDNTEEQVLLASTYHLAPLKKTKTGKDGKIYRWYVLLKGSSDYTVEEMNMLINLAVQDAVSLGIQVLTPEELAHLMELEKNNPKRTKV